jgi:diacylglycerol O-acyltransferase
MSPACPPRPSRFEAPSRQRGGGGGERLIREVLSPFAGLTFLQAWADWRVEVLYSVGPLIEGVGLNVTAWSYVDRLYVSALSCPALLHDPHTITDGVHAALTELLAALPGTGSAAHESSS